MSKIVRAGVASAVLAAALGLGTMPAIAATRVVTLFSDTLPGTPPGSGTGAPNDLRNAILAANGSTGDLIEFNCPVAPCVITLNGPLPPITASMTIDGGSTANIVIDGAATHRAFFVDSGTVAIRNLTIRNVRAKGGDGGTGAGGGAGMGAGLFLNQAGANVTVNSVAFSYAAAVGGAGGAGGSAAVNGGGGGGLGGNGGNGAPGGTEAGGGGGGVLGTGAAGSGVNGGAGGIGGGGGGGFAPTGAAGAGGVAYATNDAGTAGTANGGAGGFGGGGGGGASFRNGATGGFGGGGGAGGATGGNGGDGGFGGGSGGGGIDNMTTAGIGGGGGGGVAGGNGGGGSVTQGGGGGGGAAAGPAIFVRMGTLTVASSTSFGETATAGAGGTGATNGSAGTASAVAVFNHDGTINASAALGPRADVLPAPSYGLTVTVSGAGTVTSSTGGLNCPGTCSASIAAPTSVTLSATAAAGSSFFGWSGDCSGPAAAANVTMNAPRACLATFVNGGPVLMPTPVPPFVLQPIPPSVSVPIAIDAAGASVSGVVSVRDILQTIPLSALVLELAPTYGPFPPVVKFVPYPGIIEINMPLGLAQPNGEVWGPLPIEKYLYTVPLDINYTDQRAASAVPPNLIYPLRVRMLHLPLRLKATSGTETYTAQFDLDVYSPRPTVTKSIVSLSLDGAIGNGRSGRPALSWDGGQMVFETASTNLFPAMANSQSDIVRYHGLTGDRDRLSQTAIPGGGVANAANGASTSPAVSSDGRYAAFASEAPGITLIPAGRARQVYRTALGFPRVPLNHAVTPAPDFVSITADGAVGNGASDNPDMSQDGRYVVFESTATNFGVGLDGTRQVWRKDMQTGALDLVSGGRFPGNGPSGKPSISWDGRYIAFESSATTFGASGTQVYLRDMTSNSIRLVSAAGGQPGNAGSSNPRLTARADRIAFVTAAGNLGAAVGRTQIVVADLASGAIRPVAAGNGDSDQPAISADGRFVVFRSTSSDLVTGFAGSAAAQIFIADVDRGVTALVTQTEKGGPVDGANWNPALAGDGVTIGFGSDATNLVPGKMPGGQLYLVANPLPMPARTGYWYLPSIGGGQGWAMERWGNRTYIGGLAYDGQGHSQWLAGMCIQSGMTCSGRLDQWSNAGSPEMAAGPSFTLVTSTDGLTANLSIGGATAQRLLPFQVGGPNITGYPGLPQAGWWYEPGAGGKNVGYFLDIDTQPQPNGSMGQVAYLTVAGYDASGRAVWQSAQAVLGPDLSFSGTLTQYSGGAPFGASSSAAPASGSAVGQVRMTFDGPDRARITLPDGKAADLARFRF